MKIKDLIVVGILLTAGAGVTLGIEGLIAYFNPKPTVEVRDFTGNKRSDVLIDFGRGKTRWLLDCQNDGTYLPAVEIDFGVMGKKFLNLKENRFYNLYNGYYHLKE
jgi:hypothetical protein